jgi:hypothetical protein
MSVSHRQLTPLTLQFSPDPRSAPPEDLLYTRQELECALLFGGLSQTISNYTESESHSIVRQERLTTLEEVRGNEIAVLNTFIR